jgi:acylphosphatase
MKARAHVIISGYVQGVFFRANTKREAINLGLKGFVRNLDDGRVEAVFEGEKSGIEKAIEFCKKGPRGARVDNVDVKWEEYKGEFHDFEIRYF